MTTSAFTPLILLADVQIGFDPFLLSSHVLLWGTMLCTLVSFWVIGSLLVPRRMLAGPKMLRLAVVMCSGLVFATGVSALFCLRHWNAVTFIPVAQLVGLGLWFYFKRPTTAEVPATERWQRREVFSFAALTLGLMIISVLLSRWWTSGGDVVLLHEDMGFFVSLVNALPEARAANTWCIFMGEQTVEASGLRDAWYHWGGIMLAIGIRGLSGLSSAASLLLATVTVLNVLLMVCAAALTESLWRLRPAQAALAGITAILSLNMIRVLPEILTLLTAVLPYEIFHHVRVSLALTFPYKYEGLLLLLTLALWQAKQPRLALAALYVAACSAPHNVAVAAASCATLGGVGVLMRDRSMMRAGFFATATTLAGWATMHFFFGSGLSESKGAPAMSLAALSDLPLAFVFGLLDSSIAAILSFFFVTGAVFLIIYGRREQRDEARLLGWLCLAGILGSSLALQAMRCGDRFHVVVFTHAALVMPVGICGLIGMMRLAGTRVLKYTAFLFFICAVSLGVSTQLKTLWTHKTAAWKHDEIRALSKELQGRPFGYFALNDRNWWISKHALLGGMIESRCMRLNPNDESKSVHFSKHNSTLPLQWLPPHKDERAYDWSLRLARKVGVNHLIETQEDQLPKRIRSLCRQVWAGSSGLTLYEMPPDVSPPQ